MRGDFPRPATGILLCFGFFCGLMLTTTTTIGAQGLSPKPAPPVTTADLERLCTEALAAFKVPGMAVGVIKDGKVVLSQGFGVRKLGAGAKPKPGPLVDANTLFAIASNTKAFIGTSVALLAAEDKLTLEDPLTKHLPYLKFSDPHVTALANVTDILSHRSGLGTFKGDHLWFKRTVSPREVLTKVGTMPLEYPFRAGYGYSNLGFIAAGEVIRAVTGEEWAAFAKTRFWEPLGMARTRAHVRDLPDDNFAYGHITRQTNTSIAPVPWENSGAAGGIWSSSSDMLRWLEANLGRGTFRGDTIWPVGVQEAVWKPRNIFGGAGDFSSYGLGWFISNVNGHAVMSHGGGYDGQYSQVMLVPDLGLGIVVLSNSMTGLPASLSRQIRDLYLGTAKSDWIATATARDGSNDEAWFARQDKVDAQLAEARSQPNQLPDITGTYRDAVYGDFTIAKAPGAGDALMLTFPRSTLLQARLEPAGGSDLYRLAWTEQHAWWDRGAMQMSRDGDGGVHLQLDIPNDDIFFETIDALRVK